MRAVQTGPVTGLVAQLGAARRPRRDRRPRHGRLGRRRRVRASVTTALLARGLARAGAARLGPADRVTLTRAALVGGVAALTADSFSRPTPVAVLVGARRAVALVLDAVDGGSRGAPGQRRRSARASTWRSTRS